MNRGDFPAKPRTLDRIGARPRSELTTNGTAGEQMANPFVLSLSKDVHQSCSWWRTVLTRAVVRRVRFHRDSRLRSELTTNGTAGGRKANPSVLRRRRQADLFGDGLHALHDERDVFVQVYPQFVGALLDVVPADILGEGLVFHLLTHRLGRHFIQGF